MFLNNCVKVRKRRRRRAQSHGCARGAPPHPHPTTGLRFSSGGVGGRNSRTFAPVNLSYNRINQGADADERINSFQH